MIAIAGAGIGGLTLAVALQRQGWHVVVLERQPEVGESGAGITLWPNALAALDSIGLGDAVRSTGRALSAGGLLRSDGERVVTFSSSSFHSALGEALVCVHRAELVGALAGMLTPGTVRTGQEVTGLEASDRGVRVLCEGETAVAAAALVGADGIRSAVARTVFGAPAPRYSGYTAWRGIAAMDTGADEFFVCVGHGHEFGWLPIPGGRTYWFATGWLPEAPAVPEEGWAYLTSTFGRWATPVPDLLESTDPAEIVRNDIVDRAMPARLTAGSIVLLGDAAHPMRPHLGQGGCQAVEDAATLARCLASTSEPGDAFLRYERLRRRRVARVVRASKLSGFTRPEGPLTTGLDRMTSLLPGVPIGPLLRAAAPVAGYRAGARAVG